MNVEHVNPFLSSVVTTFQTMLDCEAKRGEISLAVLGAKNYPISGVIGLSGKAVGIVVINLSEDVALKAASKMLMEEYTEINSDVIDAVGELANIVAGQAKAELEEYNLSVSLPSVITGKEHVINFPSNAQPICVPFKTDFGPLNLEVGFEEILEPAVS